MKSGIKNLLLVGLLLVPLFYAGKVCMASQEQGAAQTGTNVPEWARNVVWYQIFPERFHNADNTNDPVVGRVGDPHGWDPGAPEEWRITPWTSDWYQRADWEQRVGREFYRPYYGKGHSDRKWGDDGRNSPGVGNGADNHISGIKLADRENVYYFHNLTIKR